MTLVRLLKKAAGMPTKEVIEAAFEKNHRIESFINFVIVASRQIKQQSRNTTIPKKLCIIRNLEFLSAFFARKNCSRVAYNDDDKTSVLQAGCCYKEL